MPQSSRLHSQPDRNHVTLIIDLRVLTDGLHAAAVRRAFCKAVPIILPAETWSRLALKNLDGAALGHFADRVDLDESLRSDSLFSPTSATICGQRTLWRAEVVRKSSSGTLFKGSMP
jgi:hypothetical protein